MNKTTYYADKGGIVTSAHSGIWYAFGEELLKRSYCLHGRTESGQTKRYSRKICFPPGPIHPLVMDVTNQLAGAKRDGGY